MDVPRRGDDYTRAIAGDNARAAPCKQHWIALLIDRTPLGRSPNVMPCTPTVMPRTRPAAAPHLPCGAPHPSCCAQSQHPEIAVEGFKPGMAGFRDCARNDEGLLIASLSAVLFQDAKHSSRAWQSWIAGEVQSPCRFAWRLPFNGLMVLSDDPLKPQKNFVAGVAGQAPPPGGAKGQTSTSSATEEQALSIKGLDPGQAGSRECRRQTTASACCGSRHAESAVY